MKYECRFIALSGSINYENDRPNDPRIVFGQDIDFPELPSKDDALFIGPDQFNVRRIVWEIQNGQAKISYIRVDPVDRLWAERQLPEYTESIRTDGLVTRWFKPDKGFLTGLLKDGWSVRSTKEQAKHYEEFWEELHNVQEPTE